MGIFGALTTAVTGLRAQSFALENISGNIANSQTTAFKRVDTSFLDLIPDNPPSKQLSGTVAASSRATNTVQGDFQSASIGTFKRGRTALDALDALKLGLLSGTLDAGALARLKSVSASLAEQTGDPGLDTVLAEIELRVGVELAKIGMPQSGRQGAV